MPVPDSLRRCHTTDIAWDSGDSWLRCCLSRHVLEKRMTGKTVFRQTTVAEVLLLKGCDDACMVFSHDTEAGVWRFCKLSDVYTYCKNILPKKRPSRAGETEDGNREKVFRGMKRTGGYDVKMCVGRRNRLSRAAESTI